VPSSPEARSALAADIDAWFLQRGVPHLMEGYDAPTAIWTRALPILVIAYLAGGLNALDIGGWTLSQNIRAAVVVIVVLVLGWALTNALLRRPFLAVPRQVGTPELIAFVIGPALPSVLFEQWWSAARAVLIGLVVLGVIYLGTSYAVVPVARWALRTTRSQLGLIGNLVTRALPLLLLFNTFLFVNAEVWQIAGGLDGPPYVAVLAIFFLLGSVFVLSRLPSSLRGLGEFATWDEVRHAITATPAAKVPLPVSGTPGPNVLTRRQRLNVGLVAVFSQAIQVTLVVVTLTVFFGVFGFLAVPLDAQLGWTTLPSVDVWWEFGVGERTLVITEPLARVAGFLGAFSGMYFTVVQSTDATYRAEFAADVGPEIRRTLAVHRAYCNVGTG
jgi:hypothetical protein